MNQPMSFSKLMGVFLFVEVRQITFSTILRTGIKDRRNRENYDRGSPMHSKIVKIIETVIKVVIAIADILRGGYDNQE